MTFTELYESVVMNCILMLSAVCVRNYMRGPKCPSQSRMDNKIVVITGANSGIGLETAKNLVCRGKQCSAVNTWSVCRLC